MKNLEISNNTALKHNFIKEIRFHLELNRCIKCKNKYSKIYLFDHFSHLTKSNDRKCHSNFTQFKQDCPIIEISFNKSTIHFKKIIPHNVKVKYKAFKPIMLKLICSNCNTFKNISTKYGRHIFINSPGFYFSLLKTPICINSRIDVNFYNRA